MSRICLILSTLLTGAVMIGCAGASATNGVPAITSVSPSSAVAGSQNTKITVSGANFIDNPTLLVNGTPRATTLLNKNQLTAVLTSTDLAQPTTLQISVAASALDNVKPTSFVGSRDSANFVVTPAALKILTTNIPAAVVHAPYSATLDARGGIAPYVWKVSSGQLPQGLSLTSSS
ncbi:MAG TPA: IPT/TIG domain-containing protein, partial [Candidatus Acidoferrum sp.]|nr:IPT/TIG domain-containing protein [Candidatus Acidoferrum sp.]